MILDVDYFELPDGKIQLFRPWTCPKCEICYMDICLRTPAIYDRPHIPDSDSCKNVTNHTICCHHEYGQHISLICAKCPATYSTKNIDYIGARSIFLSRDSQHTAICQDPDGCDLKHLCNQITNTQI